MTRIHPAEALLAATLAGLLGGMALTSSPNPDAYTYASDSLRVLAGEIPHRDYFQFTPPGTALVGALVMAVTGPSIVALRLVQGLVLVLAALLFGRLTRRLGAGPWPAALPGLALVLGLYYFQPHWNAHWLVLAPIGAALLAACRGLDGEARAWGPAGGLTGLAAILLQSDGIVLAAAIGGAIGADLIVGRADPATTARRLAAFAGGIAAALAPLAAWLGWHGALGAVYQQVWVFTLTNYAAAGSGNDIRFATDLSQQLSPFINWTSLPAFWARVAHALLLYGLVVGVAAGSLAWAAGILARRLRDGTRWDADEAAWGVCGLAALGFGILATRGRADITHVALYALPALVVATAAAAALARRLPEPGLVALRWLPLGAIAAFTLAGGVLWAAEARRSPELWLRLRSPDAEARATPLVTWLRERARPGDTLAAFRNGGYLYFYALPPAVAITHLGPGYLTDAQVRGYWQQVRERKPRFIVFVPHDDPSKNRDAYIPGGIPAGWRLAARMDDPLGGRTPWPAEIYERIGS